MQKILVDQFVVPEESKARFLEAAQRVQSFVKGLPGFVEGFLYEKREGEGRHNYFTTVVWENEVAFENARKAVAAEYKRQGYDPEQVRRELRIERERSVYERSSYRGNWDFRKPSHHGLRRLGCLSKIRTDPPAAGRQECLSHISGHGRYQQAGGVVGQFEF